MTLREQNKESNKQYIAKVAFELFCENGIENVSMPNVAKVSGVGTTSMYRYFDSKMSLVVAAAYAACEHIKKKREGIVNTDEYKSKTGVEQIHHLLSSYLELYDFDRNVLKFIYQFENYITVQKLDHETAMKYKVEFQVVKEYVYAALEKGIADGTINKKTNTELLYLTISDFILGFCSKIAYYEFYKDEKTIAKSREQLALALDITYDYIKAK